METGKTRSSSGTKPENISEVAQRSIKILNELVMSQASAGAQLLNDELGIVRAFGELWLKLASDPAKVFQTQLAFWRDYGQLWQHSLERMMGRETSPVAAPVQGDRRFRHDDWQRNLLFDFIKQAYLIAARHLHSTVAGVQGLDAQVAKKADFYTRQYIDATSPSNFLLTNPEVISATIASGGQNLVRGLSNLLRDFASGNGSQLRIRMTDHGAFRVGGNLAITPGKVIFQNELMQLIQYAPATANVNKRPLLILPPWINKFYVLDMRTDNSFVRWATEQGVTVFMLSWVNPDARFVGKTFDDYMLQGPLAALDAIEKATGEREVNALGFCLGGTLLAATLGYMAATGDQRIRSATFFASLIDFEDPGELGVFVDEHQVRNLEKKMNQRGYLEGSEMATTFNMLRANDLIWSFVVNNYLLGKDPHPFDLLYWNSDSTRMPAAMHSFYLRNMYIKNLLRVAGGISLNGVAIDLSKVRIPLYFASTIEDHIAPWKSTYAGARLFPGKVRFVLGGSGHIAGIINPPSARKYGYRTNEELPATPEYWLEGAQQHEGSWWNDWAHWIKQQGGGKVAARAPGSGNLQAIEDAPGSYVALRLDAHPANS